MNIILDEYKKNCKEAFGQYGFKSFRNNHYRVINDIYQSFNLHCSISGGECTVEFISLPMSDEYAITKDRCGADHLKLFENDNKWFFYDRQDKSSIVQCINEMIEYMKQYLFPFFDATSSSEQIYNLLANGRYLDFLAQAQRNVALKMHDYTLAKRCVQEEIEQLIFAYEQNKKYSADDMFIKQCEESFHEQYREKAYFLEYITNENSSYLDGWLENNEKKNKKILGVHN